LTGFSRLLEPPRRWAWMVLVVQVAFELARHEAHPV